MTVSLSVSSPACTLYTVHRQVTGVQISDEQSVLLTPHIALLLETSEPTSVAKSFYEFGLSK